MYTRDRDLRTLERARRLMHQPLSQRPPHLFESSKITPVTAVTEIEISAYLSKLALAMAWTRACDFVTLADERLHCPGRLSCCLQQTSSNRRCLCGLHPRNQALCNHSRAWSLVPASGDPCHSPALYASVISTSVSDNFQLLFFVLVLADILWFCIKNSAHLCIFWTADNHLASSLI